MSDDLSAAVLIIGNEILSGRTQDVNLNVIAKKLGSIGIPLKEARVVRDIQMEIVEALNALRKKYTYVFTTGGIGPTHDDITVDAVASAFDVPVIMHAEAAKLLIAYYGHDQATPARMRMARTPEGAELIANPVSIAPGIHMENVYILAGVPNIMQAMIDNIVATLRHGPAVHSATITGTIAESLIADELTAIAARFSHLDIGSYPWQRQGTFGTSLVVRGVDHAAVKEASNDIASMLRHKGIEPILSAE